MLKHKVRDQFLAMANNLGVNIHKYPSDYHLSLDYPVSAKPRYTAHAPHPELLKIIEGVDYTQALSAMVNQKALLETIPNNATTDAEPFWMNEWFSALDAVSLMHFLTSTKPSKFIEIGSGNSTKFARHAISESGLHTNIVSIDPFPRAEIDRLCDAVIRKPLETVDQSIFDTLEVGDILFFDGSHRTFMDSDVTVFFLEIVPRIKPGVLIHIHDIFLPFDYPKEWGKRYYSEQYMLAILLLFGPYRPVFPNAYIAQHPAYRETLGHLPASFNKTPASFWMIHKDH